jgi:hypothetical protein
MKHLLAILLVCPLLVCSVTGADIPAPRDSVEVSARNSVDVSKCFKVRRLLRTDATHYWADWSNSCPFTIDAVYVMVGFLDGRRHEMGNGVWPMYFVTPGAHRVTRFSAPVANFATVHVHQITTDSLIALRPDRTEVVEAEPFPVNKVGDTAVGKVIPYQPRTGNKTQY